MKRINLAALLFFIAFSSPSHGFFDPTAGRWTSRDPIGESGGENIYCFVENRVVDQVDMLGLYLTLDAAGHAGARAAAELSIRFDEIHNVDNWTYRRNGEKEGIDFKLEYAGLICENCNEPDPDDRFRHTPPHPGVVFGPYPDKVKAKLPLINPDVANYDPKTGAMIKRGGDAHAYSDPTFDHATDEAVTCEKVFGLNWVAVGHFHSHPRGSGLGPSPGDLTSTSPGRQFLGAITDTYEIQTSEY